MYIVFNNSAPSCMCDVNRTRHHYNTCRSTASYTVPHVIGQGSKSFTFNGIKLWDELPCESIQQKHIFKKECKNILMSQRKRKVNLYFSVFIYLFIFNIFYILFYYLLTGASFYMFM